MLRTLRTTALALTVGASLTLVAITTSPVEAAPRPPKPVITKVKPNNGPTTGGTLVTIKGKHLKTATKVLFGRAKGTQLKVKSDRKLKVLAPAHAAGTVDVKVKTKGGKSKKVPVARFTFVVTKPQVTGVSPTSGPTSGGTSVTVTGSGFVGVSAVTFDGMPGTFSVQSPTRLTVTSPAHAVPSAVHVNVTTPAGTSPSKAADRFTYVGTGTPPTIDGMGPMSGPTAGGVTVTVTGTAFTTASAVTFGGTPGTNLHVVSDNELTVTSPAHTAGGVQVRVVNPGGVSPDVAEDDFEYLSPTPRAAAVPLPGDADETDQGAFLNAVDCPAVQVCFAVGGYLSVGDQWPLAEQRVDSDSWQPFSPDLPADAVPGASLQDVDCVSTTFCVAVGTYQDDTANFLPYFEGWDGEEWSVATSASLPDDADFGVEDSQLLADVECPSTTRCIAVGRYHENVGGENVPLVLELSNGEWDVAYDAGSSTGELVAVDCPTESKCFAVGRDTTAVDKQLALAGPGPWTAATLTLPTGADATAPSGLRDVACTSETVCLAAGTYQDDASSENQGFVQQLGSGTWTPTATPAPAVGSATQPDVVINSVSCASTCSVVGDYAASALAGGGRRPLLVRFNGTTPVVQQGAVPGDPDGELTSSATTVLCASGGRCLGTGYYDDDSGVWTPLLQRLSGSTWTASNGPAPADNAGILKPLASDLDVSGGVAVGYYNDADGNQLALVMLDLPV